MKLEDSGGDNSAVTIAVVSHNTRELLRECLRSVQADRTQDSIEVWVVDNASSDGSAEMVAAEFPSVRLIASDSNLGFGAAVNLVAARTDGGWLAIANADVALERGALATLLTSARREPRAGALAPRLVCEDGSTQHSVFAFPGIAVALALNLGVHRLNRNLAQRLAVLGAWDPDRPRRAPWAIGAFLLLRREAWLAAGGFDERQWMYAEDLDLGWRLRRAGWLTLYEPAARVRHRGAASTTQLWGDALTERSQRSTYAWLLHRRGVLRTRAVAAINLLGCGARYIALTPAAAVGPRRFRRRREALRWWMGQHAFGLRPTSTLRAHR